VTPDEILAMRKALGERLQAVGAEPVELLVCGGPALNLRGHLAHATEAVDVVVSQEALADTDVRSRHFQDLVALRPTPEVLRAAWAWILSHNEPEEFLDSLEGALNALGASDVARELG
jgi:hypothetical protein